MTFLSNDQSIMQSTLGLTADEMAVIAQALPAKDCYEYIAHKAMCVRGKPSDASVQSWLQSYELIRDPSWPDLHNVDDFDLLPDHIKQECAVQHKFSPDIWFNPKMSFEQWNPSADFDYAPDVLLRLKCVLLDNQAYIENRRVLDFPCSYGNLSMVMAKLGPRSLTMAEVREDMLAVAREGIALVDRPGQYKYAAADIHDYRSNTDLCRDQDTVFVCGLMYHVNDHYSILASIASAGPGAVIIETQESPEVQDLSQPMIWFTQESTGDIFDGWEKDKSQILVGFPNEAWFDLAMQTLGYRKTKPGVRFGSWALNRPVAGAPAPITRSVHVYEKQQ